MLLISSGAQARPPLDYINEIDERRDDLRRQLKDPNGVIKPLSQEVSSYIAGQRGLNYTRKMTLPEREAALKSILRTAIIHGRFRDAPFREYFGELQHGQRDLYYRHVAQVSVAYNAAQCLVENQVPMSLEDLSDRVFSNINHLDIFRRYTALRPEFTKEYIARFLGQQFIKWYVELSVGFPDITNQFVFDGRFQKVVREIRHNSTRAPYIFSSSNSLGGIFDDSFRTCAMAKKKTSRSFPAFKNLALCYELAEVMGLQGLVVSVHYMETDERAILFYPFQIHFGETKRMLEEMCMRGSEKPDLKGIVTNGDHLSKILAFWFLTQQAGLNNNKWTTLSVGEAFITDTEASMGVGDMKEACIPFPFGAKKQALRQGQCEKFPTLIFSRELMRRINFLDSSQFTQIFSKYKVSETVRADFLARLGFFKKAMTRYAIKPIHELFMHLWNNSIFGDQFQVVDGPEDSIPKKTFPELFARFLVPADTYNTGEEISFEPQVALEPGILHSSPFGFGFIRYPLPVTKSSATSDLTAAEQEARRKLMVEAVYKRMRGFSNQ